MDEEDIVPEEHLEEEEPDEQGAVDTGQAKTKRIVKPKNPCIKCGKNVTKNSVQCRTCKLWVHVPCSGISKEYVAILLNPAKHGPVSWCCECCLAGASKLEDKIHALNNKFAEVEARLSKTEDNNKDTTRRIERVEHIQTNMDERLRRERDEYRKERNEEERERASRRKNVIFHGLEECIDEVVDARREWDIQCCLRVCGALKLRKTNDDIKFCRRVGVRSEEPRPLVVGFRRETCKEDILDCAAQLKNTEYLLQHQCGSRFDEGAEKGGGRTHHRSR